MTLESSEEAAEVVSKVTQETKLLCNEYYSDQTGNKVHFKPESMQYIGAYRVGGVYYKIDTLTDEEKVRGLITAPTGNHARGVVYTARPAGVKVTIVMPTTTPLIKVSRTKGYNAEMVLANDIFDEAYTRAYESTGESDYIFVYPFDDLAVAIGQGTITMEIIKELPTADYTLVPMGGGGLCADVSTLAKLLDPKIKVIGVEPAGANCMQESLKAGHVVGLPDVNIITDGTAVKYSGEKIFPYIQENMDDIITIEDNELVVAFLDMVKNHRMIVENSGLLTVTALKHMNVEKEKIVSILSGGNTDMIIMASVVQYGLIRRDRVFTISVLPPDKPGEPAKVPTLLAREQDNVIKLEYNQFININRNMIVELRIIIEAYETKHRNTIVQTLNGAGHRPKLMKFKGTYTEQDETTRETTVVTSKNT